MTDFHPTASRENLIARARLLQRSRAFFDRRDFIEVQTPVLSADTVVDRHLDPIPVTLPHDARNPSVGRDMWLQTSPEFAMKRLLTLDVPSIYQIAPAFRIGEVGRRHNPEFTLLEWYRRGDDMRAGIELLSAFIQEVLERPAAEVCTMREAFLARAGFDPLTLPAAELRERCREHDVPVPESVRDDDWDAWFDLLFCTLAQPRLGVGRPMIVHDYPASQAALARVRPGEPPVAERFELFVDGVELANGYHELLDADELLRRNQANNAQRLRDGKCALPEHSRLLRAMRAGLPPCAGVALGFDRLVMLATKASCLNKVIGFPIDRA